MTLLSAEKLKTLHDGGLPQGAGFYRYVATSLAWSRHCSCEFSADVFLHRLLRLMQGPQKRLLPDRVRHRVP